ncbi:MAG: BTAD domain-containing putative transcriptional regulator [Kineosporiaceae bacterium]
MLYLRIIGTPRIEDSAGRLRELSGQKPWAVLARVLLSDGPVSRRELSAELFPDAADPLGALRWCLARIRQAIGSSEIFTGDPIRPELPAWVRFDVQDLRDGRLDAGRVGELLDGIDPECGPEFSTWLLVARQHVSARVAARLREETITAISRGQHGRAIELAEAGARREPYDEGVHVLLVKALVAAGHTDAALRHVADVESLYRSELDCDPSPALRSAARSSVAAAPPGVSTTAIASGLLTAGRAAIAAGAVDAGLECLRRAGAQAEAIGDGALLGRCLLELGSALVHTVRGFDDEGSVLLEQAVHLARASGDLSTAVGALRERGYVNSLAGRRHEAEQLLDRAIALADGATELLAGAYAVSAVNLSDWGRYDESIARFETAIDLARSAGDRRWEGWALGLGGWTALLAGRGPTAVSWSSQSLQVVRSRQWTAFEPLPILVLAEAGLTGRTSAVTSAELERCFATSCYLDDPCWQGASGRMLALHHAGSGDIDCALRWITEARTRALSRSDTWAAMIGAILLSEAEIRLDAGDVAGADGALRELIAYAARAHLDELLRRALDLTAGIA